jgi:competence protein ComEA
VRLRPGDRVGDAIEAAGGFGPRVDLAETGRSLNLAQPLTDGLKVLVPELGASGGPRANADDGRIDLNTADQAALESLPGIGPVTATKIMEARAEQPFRSVEDLRDRGIVGDAVYTDIEALVRAAG